MSPRMLSVRFKRGVGKEIANLLVLHTETEIIVYRVAEINDSNGQRIIRVKGDANADSIPAEI